MGDDSRPTELARQLRAVFNRAKVPTNPTTAVEILRLADDPRSSAEQFAELIQTDAALAARLLAMANAAMFAQREPVTTIKRAVTLLGLRRIRMVSLGFQLVSHLDRLGGKPFELERFWQHSVLRACLAREVAAVVVPAHADEAFLVGLLQDCGILLLVQLYGKPYAALCSQALSPTAFREQERKNFEYSHDEAVYALAREWNLPAIIAWPLGRHHTAPERLGDTPAERLSAVSYFVGSLPLAGHLTLGAAEPGLRQLADQTLGIDAAGLEACLRRAGEAYTQVAAVLAEQLPSDLDVTDLLDEANHYLARFATEAEVRAAAVEMERDEIHQQTVQLEAALGQYRERAARDPLTGLLNRGALTEATQACLRVCVDLDQAMAVYFLDIDDFKMLNDSFGHHVGDEALRALADRLSGTVFNGGFAGRYGGEEFVVVIPDISEADARGRAAALLRQTRRVIVEDRGLACSVGVLWGRPDATDTPHALFEAADKLMYQAKLEGKDRACYRRLDHDAPEMLTAEAGGDDPAAPVAHGAASDAAGPRPTVSEADLRALAIDLNRADTHRFTTVRKRERQGLLAPCTVNGFVSGGSSIRSYGGYVRNISIGGVGVLTTRAMIRGEPVEVVLDQKDRGERLYMGGLIAFCRHVRDGIYEVGVQLVTRGAAPVLARDANSPRDQLDWVCEALRDAHGGGEHLRETA